MAHGAALRCRDARDETDHRLGSVRGDPARGLDLEVSADFADHDDAIGVVIRHEELDRLEGRGADDGVTADADGRGLAHARFCDLVDGLVGERPGFGHNSDAAGVENEPRHDAHLCLARRHDAGAVRSDECAVSLVDVRFDARHV